jgi:hypothetical protein
VGLRRRHSKFSHQWSGRQFVTAPSPEHVDMAIENVVDISTR